MLLVYRTSTGEVLDNAGTNSLFLDGVPDEFAYVNTDAAGIDRAELSLLRLNDVTDAALVARILTCGCAVQNGQAIPSEPPEQPDATIAPIGPAEGTGALAEVTQENPLTIEFDDGTSATGTLVRRHAGYTPTAGDTVDVTWRSGAWLVRDAVVSGSTTS